MKLAFVVQRYGADIAGGSELHCRDLAQRLAPQHDITVLTSCARDYVSWANEYPAGESSDGAVRVIRFAVSRPRHVPEFSSLSEEVFEGGAPHEQQEEWFRENGRRTGPPRSSASARSSYDAVLFWTFRYYPSFFGVPLVRDRAVLLPTAEDDPAVHLDITEEFFNPPAAFLFLTPEEQALVSARAGRTLRPSAVIGTGLEPAGPSPSRDLLRSTRYSRRLPSVSGKSRSQQGMRTRCSSTLKEYASNIPGDAAGAGRPGEAADPEHDRIRALGYVSDDMRTALLSHARLLVVPSPYESLGIALLEAWNHGVPALVNARCLVLKEQVRRANGGLYYRSFSEFCGALDYLATHPDERRALGAQGLRFVEREYRWQTVLPTSRRAAQKLTDGAGIGGGVALGLTNRPERAAPSPNRPRHVLDSESSGLRHPAKRRHPGGTERHHVPDNREP